MPSPQMAGRLVLDICGEIVLISSIEDCPEGPEIVHEWLRSHAQAVLEARRRHAQKGRTILSRAEEEGHLPTSTEGLLAYIGFPWTSGPNWFFPGCLLLLAIIAALLAVLVV